MLESGIDRIISQVVDPKINHIFRPQVEKAVHEFLAILNHKEEASPSTPPSEEKPEASVLMQGVSTSTPSASVANDAMSILETITSLNQEANATRSSTEVTNSKTNDKVSKRSLFQQSLDSGIEREGNTEDLLEDEEKLCFNSAEESSEQVVNCEGVNNVISSCEEGKAGSKEVINPSKDIVQETDEQKSKQMDKCDRKLENSEKGERRKEKKEKSDKKLESIKKSVDDVKSREEKAQKDRETESMKYSVLEKSNSKYKGNESAKEAFEDSDVDILSDITVSSVHTSDLSSFEEESEEEDALSDSTEEGEIFSDDEEEQDPISSKTEAACTNDKKKKPGRHAYVHKPYLYSKYYSDSDDERTVEQRRQSVAREKEERLLRRQLNREKLEEKRKQKAAEKTKILKTGNQGKSIQTFEELSTRDQLKASGATMKDVLKEQRILEKKVALSRKRKRETRHNEECKKKKCEQSEENLGEHQKISETSEKSSSKELKAIQGKNEERKNQDLVHSSDENKIDSKVEKEHKRKASTSSHLEGTQQDGDIQDSKSQINRTDDSSEEPPKQKNVFKNEKHIKKDDLETISVRNVPKKEVRLSKERNEKERNLSEEKLFTKHKSKGDIHKTGEEVESLLSEKGLKNEESFLKHGQLSRALVDEKAEKKNKHRTERKISVSSKDVKNISDHGSKNEENSHKESNKKDRQISTDKLRIEHKSKKLSVDFRPQKESHSVSKQHSSLTSRRSESYTEDKHEVGLSNMDNILKQGDGTQKDRHRSKSVLEERTLLKSRPKSHSRQVKIPESELQESSSKQEHGQKLDKDKNTEENDPDKQYKLKNEIKVLEENDVEFELEHGALSVSSSQKDASHRVKSQLVEKSSMKEKLKSDKDLSNFRPERKLSVEGHKNRGPKYSSKDLKKREDNKPEDRSVKQLESSTKIQEKGLLTDKKTIKRLTSENRKGSLSAREVDIGKEKLSPATSVASLSPTLQNTNWISEELSQEPAEIMSEKKHGDAYHQITQVEGSSNNSEESKSTSISKECKLNQKLNVKELQRHSLSSPNLKQNTEFSSTKDFSSPFYAFKQDSKDGGVIEEEQYSTITSKENAKLEFKAGIEDAETPENLKNIMNPSEESSDPTKDSREEAAHQKCMDIDLTEVTGSLGGFSKDGHFNSYRSSIKDTTLDNETHTVKKEQCDNFVMSSSVKEDSITNMEIINTDGRVHLHSKQAAEEKSVLTDIQEATVKEKNGDGILESDSLIGEGIKFTDVNAEKSVLIRIEGKGDNVDGGSSAVNDKNATECQNNTEKSNRISAPKELCSELVSPNASEDMSRFSAMVNEVERRYDDVRSQSENSVVASSIGGSSCIDICSSIEHDVVVIGTSTERNMGRTMTATSTALDEEVMSEQQKEKDAVITCSEEMGKTALSCTNREADEGYIVGTWTENKESVHFVTGHFGECTVTTAEESGAVSEGLAVCESSSASTKEDESAECIANYVEESTKQLVNKSGIENDQNVNSLILEEKDDAVTSASSEERCMASACGGTSNFDSAAVNIGEMESDGAVTSAGAEAQDSSVIIENPDGFQSNATGTQQVKGAEGVVTCTGTERPNGDSAICSVTGTDLQEVSVVNRVYAEMDNSEEVGSHVDKNEDVISGESTVTSTSITAEDDPEAEAACTGLEDNDEGFVAALNMEENYEHATDSTEARAEKNMIETSQGSYDDEGCVTSTGAKEDDEEGENFVTSTGRCNEEAEHILTCTETEESGKLMVGLEASENRHSSISQVADQLGPELNEPTSNADKSSIDSMMNSEKKVKIGDISNSIKGIVESSTTSIGIDSENVAFVAEKEEDSSLIKKYEYDMISAASNNQSLYDFSAQEEKKERVTSCLDSRECESTLRMVSKKVSITPAPTNEADKDERETISTSTIKLSPTLGHFSAVDIEQLSSPVAKLVENISKTNENQMLLSAEDYSSPMPSTGVGIQDEMATKLNKGSAIILEEFEAPMPSITGEDDVNMSAPVRAVEMNTNVGRYTVPLPSISSADGSFIDHSKEEREECTVISTSIVEGTEISTLQEGIEDTAHLSLLKSEQSTDAAIISTSLAEYSETSVFPAKMQEIDEICKIKEKPETSAISTTEECERTTHDIVIPMETRERNEDSMVFTAGIEECKVIRESTGGNFELAVQSAEENNQSTIALVKEGRHSNALAVSATNNKSDHHLITPSVQMQKESTNLSGRILDECDSVNTVVASEESALTFLEETSLSFLNVEVEDNKKTADCAKQSDCIMLSPLVSNGKSSAVLHREGHKFHQGDPDGVLEESNTCETTSTESIEMLPKTLKSTDAGTNLCTESCFNSSVNYDSSTELILQKTGTQNSGQCVEDPSNSSVTIFEKTSTIENLSTDCINHKPALKTERMDSPNRKNFISLGKNSENRTHASETDLCSAHYEPKAFSQSTTAYSTDNREIPVVVEDFDGRMKMTVEEELPGKKHLQEENKTEEILKGCESSDSPVEAEAKDNQVPEEKASQIPVAVLEQKEESLVPETNLHLSVQKGNISVCQILGEEAEHSKCFEAKSANTKAVRDSEEILESTVDLPDHSSKAVEGKDEKVDKVEILEEPDLESSLNPVEVNQQITVKRKRGRPRKYPVEVRALQSQDSEADTSAGIMLKTSSPRGRQKITSKVIDSLNENEKHHDTKERKAEMVLYRRGRKRKQPLSPSEETGIDTSEPDKKWQKLIPAIEKETKDQDESKEHGHHGREAAGSSSDTDEIHSGATTRSASRLEAQRKQPSKPTTRAASKNQSPDPVLPTKHQKLAGRKISIAKSNRSPKLAHSKLQSAKRKREISPPALHKKLHQRTDETKIKKSKR